MEMLEHCWNDGVCGGGDYKLDENRQVEEGELNEGKEFGEA